MTYLMIILISMLPLIEIRGAIPYAQINAVPLIYAYPLAILGNMLPVPVIFLFARKVLIWGKSKNFIGNIFSNIISRGERAGAKLQAKAGRTGIFLALLLFVGIPLPGTGAWTGTLAASFLDLDAKNSIWAIMLGVVLSGAIMAVISKGIIWFIS